MIENVKRYKIPLVDESGKTVGYRDRWRTHRVRTGRSGPILGEKHVGITIACLDDEGRILVQHRRHRIFDRVWSLSGDTHPRKYDGRKVESLFGASRRCAKEDLGVVIKNWREILSVSYSARDPRDPRYCENELLHVLAAKHSGPMKMNRNSAYELRWAEFAEISADSRKDSKKQPIDRKYAPWVHAMFSLPRKTVEEAFRVT
jgi:isopentenyldiphosphate isomerase